MSYIGSVLYRTILNLGVLRPVHDLAVVSGGGERCCKLCNQMFQVRYETPLKRAYFYPEQLVTAQRNDEQQE